MIRPLKKLNQAGDTIVEVLIVLAVLGMAMSISYATANKGLQQSRNAEEHSQALGIINSQIELLRSAYANKAGSTVEAQAAAGAFCLSPPPTGQPVNIRVLGTGINGFRDNITADHLNNFLAYPGPCLQNSLYNISIVGRGNNVYDIRVRWEGLGTLGRQQEELTYRIGTVTVTPGTGYINPQIPPPPPPPGLTISLTSDKSSVAAGESIQLTWSTNPNAAGCSATDDWSGHRAGSGTYTYNTQPSDAGRTLTFTLFCQNGTDSATQPITVAVTSKQSLAILYRLYSPWYLDHLYSTDNQEGRSSGFQVEGNVGKVDTIQAPGEIPLYRLHSVGFTDYLYTTDLNEIKNATDKNAGYGYASEGIAGYIMPYSSAMGLGCPAGTQPLYRMYSSYLTDHFYTTDYNEYVYEADMSPTFMGGAYFPWYNYPEGIVGCTFLGNSD